MKVIRSQKGQVLLIVVLTMIVALTVGLSIASRTITNLKISKQNEESQRAFHAAEAGVEQALKQLNQASISNPALGNNAGYSAQIEPTKGNAILLNGGDLIDQDAGLDVWLSTYPTYADPMPAGSTVTIYWGDPAVQIAGKCAKTDGNAINSALEVVVLSGNTGTPSLNKYVFDPCSRIQNAPYVSGGNVLSTSFSYNTGPISVANGLIMKIIPIYNSTKIGITSSGADLPSQGSTITSTGTSGDTVRKVVYFSSYPQIPLEIFPYSLVAQ